MSTPIAQPSDLGTFLDIPDIDETRATLILQMAQDLCESIVSPVPTTAMVVVLTVASRSWSNPEGNTAETAGPFTVTRALAMYLTKSDKATLRRLSGGSGAFSIDTLPTGTSAVQLVTLTATAGTFALAFGGAETGPIAWDPGATDVQNALSALGLIGAGNVSVTGTGPFTVSFINNLATTPVPTMTADVTNLTGSVAVSVITTGVFAPGQRLPSWDRDYYNHGALIRGL